MKVVSQSDLLFLSCVQRKSRAGDVYNYVTLFDGGTAIELFASQEVANQCAGRSAMSPCCAEFDITKRDKSNAVALVKLIF